MAAHQTYHILTAAVHTLSAAPLLFSPQLAVTLLAPHPLQTDLPPTEAYLLRAYGLTLLALALLSAVLSGALPLSEPGDERNARSDLLDAAGLVVTAVHHGAQFVAGYVSWAESGGSVVLMGVLASGGLAVLAGGLMVFGEGGRSKVSGFLFPSEDKRRRKRERLEKRFGGQKVM